MLANGKPVRDAKTWNEKRRPEIVRLFEENQFGRAPGRPAAMSFDVFDKGTPAFDGKAIRRQVTIYFSADKTGPKMDLLIYLPANASKPVPLLLNLSFSANSNTVDDPGIKPGEVWGRDKKKVPASQGTNFGKLNVAPPARRRLRLRHGLLRRHRSRFPGRRPAGRARALPEARPDRARAGRVGLHRRLGLGPEPRPGLSGDRQGRGREARRDHRRLAAGQDGDVGRRARSRASPW